MINLNITLSTDNEIYPELDDQEDEGCELLLKFSIVTVQDVIVKKSCKEYVYCCGLDLLYTVNAEYMIDNDHGAFDDFVWYQTYES